MRLCIALSKPAAVFKRQGQWGGCPVVQSYWTQTGEKNAKAVSLFPTFPFKSSVKSCGAPKQSKKTYHFYVARARKTEELLNCEPCYNFFLFFGLKPEA